MITFPNISNIILTGSMLSFRKTMAQHWSHLTKVSLQGSFIATVLAHWINNPSSHAASQIKGPGALEQNAEPVS
jgi:ABC-type sulfate transport system permease component